MRLAIINNTSYGTSGGHLEYLSNVLPILDKHNLIKSLLFISPPFYDYSYKNKLSSKIIFKTFKSSSIFYGDKCSSELELILDGFRPDVIFFPSERLISYKMVPTLIMVRNMEPFVKIKNNTYREKVVNYVKYITTKRSCKSATHIVAVSNYVKESLIKSFHINGDKIHLIYHGGAVIERIEKLAKPKSCHIDDKKEFLFTAGSIRPARGLEDIIIALGTLNKKYEVLPDLLIAGECVQNMRKYKKSLMRLVRKCNLENTVKWVGKLNQMEMGWCYRNSRVTILYDCTRSHVLWKIYYFS